MFGCSVIVLGLSGMTLNPMIGKSRAACVFCDFNGFTMEIKEL